MEKDIHFSPLSPSFSIYSGDPLAETAEQVARTFLEDDYNRDDEFEFAILQSDPDAASSSCDGGVFPVFNKVLIPGTSAAPETSNVSPSSPETLITPLKDLFLRERSDEAPQQIYSSSSDEEEEEEDDDTIPTEIYCPWTPARSTAEMSPSGGCRKSKSTGSSSTTSWSTRRWRIRDLLKRSRSDGKRSLKFLDSNGDENNREMMKQKKEKEKVSVSAHEKFYLRNKAMKEEDKRKSYLPYKQDLVGLFSNINRYGPYGKAFPPF